MTWVKMCKIQRREIHTSEENKIAYTVYNQSIVQSKRALLGTPNIRVVVLCTIEKDTFGDLDLTDSEQACDHL